MTHPLPGDQIVLKVSDCAKMLDAKIPGWARKVPLTQVDISKVETSPLAFIIGRDWDQRITSTSAMEMMVYTPYVAVAETANGAWQRQIALRRANLVSATV